MGLFLNFIFIYYRINYTFLKFIVREGNGTSLQYSCLENPMDGGAWQAAVHGVAKSRLWLSDFTFTFHFHALERELATHSSVLAWRIPGMGESGGLPSMGSHRVGHDWSDLAAAVSTSFTFPPLSWRLCKFQGITQWSWGGDMSTSKKSLATPTAASPLLSHIFAISVNTQLRWNVLESSSCLHFCSPLV